MFLSKRAVLFLIFLTECFAKPSSSPKIVIVGAGLSGFTAAANLIENGFDDIVIIEAENRIGGRIHSVPFANGKIDLGAQWVHGETNNVVYDLMHKHFEFGDTGVEKTLPIFQNSNGKPANQKHCLKLTELAEKILVSYAEMAKFNGTLGHFFAIRYKKELKSFKYIDILPDLSNQIMDYYEKEINIWNGSETWFDISARLNTISGNNDGNQFLTWRDKGYITVFDFLSKKLPNPAKDLKVESKIRLNRKVLNIKRDSKSRSKNVEVTVNDGSKFTADHVIFTPSLGVLKQKHKALFTPQLPKQKIKAIESMGFGTLGKIFLEFERPFWPTDVNQWVGYSFLWTRFDIENLRGSDREWLINIRSFIRVDSFPYAIEALLAGKRMDEFELLADQKVIDDCKWLLEKFLGKRLPRPTSMRRTRWLTNSNFFGTYSYQSLSADRNKVLPKDLAESLLNSVKKPIVLFAGEATDYEFPSNAHGAVSSGIRAAKEIIDYYK